MIAFNPHLAHYRVPRVRASNTFRVLAGAHENTRVRLSRCVDTGRTELAFNLNDIRLKRVCNGLYTLGYHLQAQLFRYITLL
jgi:hypothetical protein